MILRTIRVVALAAVFTLTFAGVASAAQPANQACFGTDVSGYATSGGGLHYLPALVQTVRPWGQAIQAHQAGLIPDDPLLGGIPNSCNDPD